MLNVPGYCTHHQPQVHREYGRARRGFDTELGFYQSARWRNTREAVLRDNPLCCRCQAKGLLQPAKVVDHIVPVKLGGERFERANLQSLCVPCHNAKTASETASLRNQAPS